MPRGVHDHLWKKGQSGNPSGCPKSNLSKLLTELLHAKDESTGKTNERMIVERMVDMAKSGDREILKFIWERREGKTPENIAMQTSGTMTVKVVNYGALPAVKPKLPTEKSAG